MWLVGFHFLSKRHSIYGLRWLLLPFSPFSSLSFQWLGKGQFLLGKERHTKRKKRKPNHKLLSQLICWIFLSLFLSQPIHGNPDCLLALTPPSDRLLFAMIIVKRQELWKRCWLLPWLPRADQVSSLISTRLLTRTAEIWLSLSLSSQILLELREKRSRNAGISHRGQNSLSLELLRVRV